MNHSKLLLESFLEEITIVENSSFELGEFSIHVGCNRLPLPFPLW